MFEKEQELIDRYIARNPNTTILGKNYEVLPGFMQYGEGDLLLDRGNRLSAIEFKYIDYSNANTNSSRKKKKVREQALLYAAYAKVRYPDRKVEAVTVVNRETNVVCQDIPIKEAKQIVIKFIIRVGMGYIPTIVLPSIKELFNA